MSWPSPSGCFRGAARLAAGTLPWTYEYDGQREGHQDLRHQRRVVGTVRLVGDQDVSCARSSKSAGRRVRGERLAAAIAERAKRLDADVPATRSDGSRRCASRDGRPRMADEPRALPPDVVEDSVASATCVSTSRGPTSVLGSGHAAGERCLRHSPSELLDGGTRCSAPIRAAVEHERGRAVADAAMRREDRPSGDRDLQRLETHPQLSPPRAPYRHLTLTDEGKEPVGCKAPARIAGRRRRLWRPAVHDPGGRLAFRPVCGACVDPRSTISAESRADVAIR